MSAVVSAGEPRPTCFVELPVYDAKGTPIASKIVGVSFHGQSTDLLRLKQNEFRIAVNGSRVIFSENMIAKRPLDVTIDHAGKRISKLIVLNSCQQRTSIDIGQQETYSADMGWSVLRGRITGCHLSDDWWLRAMPMFGGHEGPALEGYIDPANGRFSLSCQRGVRHIVIIGRDKEPIRAFAVNIIFGGKNDIGNIDLHDVCPK